ncbi:MAG: hypothetical protein PHT36_00430 [Patescibacteria group bacterium]|nr:hypothetical protein [Patescibacteria group bacterium]
MKKNLNLKIDLRKLELNAQKTDWQRGLLFSLVLIFVVFLLACGYFIIRPLPKDIKDSIDKEISSVDINFNEKTLDDIKARQNPTQLEEISTGKNPFTSF